MERMLHTQGFNQLLLDSMIEPIVIINPQGIITAVNQAWLYSPLHNGGQLGEYKGIYYPKLYAENNKLVTAMNQVLAGELKLHEQEIMNAAPAVEEAQFYRLRIAPIKQPDDSISGALLVYCNITDQKKQLRELKDQAEQYRLIAEYSQDMIKITDINGTIEYTSPSLLSIFDHLEEKTKIFEYIHPEDVRKTRDIYQNMIETKGTYVMELRKKHKDGSWLWLETAFSPVCAKDGSIYKVIVVSRDNRERKNYELSLEKMAYHDFLTGLYNRRKLITLAEEALEEAAASGEMLGFLVMDLDKFKLINDTYGHDIGDMVLKEFSKRLLLNKRAGDIVGRLSGDEFALVMRDIHEKEDIHAYIGHVQEVFRAPCHFPNIDQPIFLNPSIGYSLYPKHGRTIKQLFKYSDKELYKKKKANLLKDRDAKPRV